MCVRERERGREREREREGEKERERVRQTYKRRKMKTFVSRLLRSRNNERKIHHKNCEFALRPVRSNVIEL